MTVSTASETAFPAWWDYDEDGDHAEGVFVRLEEAPMKDGGRQLLLVLNVGGELRSFWLHWTALRNKVVQRLELGDIAEGERVVIDRLEKKQNEKGDRSYIDFRVAFPDAPRPSQQALASKYTDRFGSDDTSTPEQAEKPAAQGDEEIPF